MNKEIFVKVPGDHEFMKICRSVATAAAAVAGFDIEATDDIGLAVFEGTKVLVCHRHDKLPESYNMTINITDEKFVVKLSVNTEFVQEKHRTICLDCPCEGEIGREVANSLMDETRLEEGTEEGDIFILTKYL
ncbi:MAG: hypothetical protein PUI85_04975 [Eubacteriales bacterium]|nr:hypothetical protein [Eubacteriales bacterium]MDY3332453.1 hypothetical protein [Gallibacter sp.]